MEPIKMTRAEYESKYGKAPVSAAPASSTQTPVKMTRAQYESTYKKPVPGSPEKPDGFLKGLVKAPLTMVARPFQAAAALAGVSDEAIDKFSKEKLGGFVAPTPDNLGEVKQDIGRAVQTVSYGMPGLASGGAAFGVGSSLEKGNNLFSRDTAVESVLSAGGAKLGGMILNPLFKGVGKFVPQEVKNKVGSTISKVSEGASKIELLPAEQSSVINKFANKAEDVINKPFEMARNTFLPKSENLVSKTLGISNSKGAKDFKRLNKGETMEEYLVRTGNINDPETTMMKEFEKATQSRVSGEEMMKEVPGIHKNEYVEEAIKGLIDKESKIGVPGGDSSEIINLANKYQKQGGLTFSEANRVKQLYEKNVKLDFLKERASDGIQRANRIDQGIRQWQRNTAKKGGFTNLEDIMKQTQNARMIANELYKKSLKGDAAKGFNLFDAVLLAGGNPTGLGLAFGRRLFSSDTARVGIARAMNKTKPEKIISPKRGQIKDFFLPEPKAGSPKTTQGPITQKIKGGPTLFTSPKGKTTPIKQEAVDIASTESGKAKKPSMSNTYKKKDNKQGGFINPKVAAVGAVGTGGVAAGTKLTEMYKEAKEFNSKVFRPSEKQNTNKTQTPKIVETIKMPSGKTYHKLESGNEVVEINPKIKKSLNKVYKDHPEVEKGVIEALLMKESSGGYDKSNENPNIGKYAWIGGIAGKSGALGELDRLGIDYDLNTPEGTLDAMAKYWKVLKSRPSNKNKTPIEIYDKGYSSGKLKSSDIKKFEEYLKFYSND